MSDGFDLSLLLDTFRAEAEERLAAMEEALLGLAERPDDPDLLHTIFRAVHTLKGDSLTVGYARLGELAHVAEDLLDRLRGGDLDLLAPAVPPLLRAVDVMREMARGKDEAPAAYDAVLAALRELLRPAGGGEGDSSSSSPASPAGAASAADQPAGGERLRTLRVGVEKLDRLLDLMGEIGVARGRLRQTLAGLAPRDAAEPLRAYEDADPLYLELHELVMRARLVPIGPVLRQQQRTVHDVAAAVGKPARLLVEDHDVEVDAKVGEQIRAPLAHLVRNAIDHGIEPEAERRRRGKEPVGTVAVRAYHEGPSVVVEVADDGGGLDRRRILAAAAARGLAPAEGEAASANDLWRLLCRPGFTTAGEVTGISGRGVGLDVVERAVGALRGAVEVESRAGLGAVFRIRLPLTLAIIEGFGVGVGAETYLLPLENVRECIELPAGEARDDGPSGVADLHGQPLPFLRLRHHLGVAAPRPARESVVVVEDGRRRIGLVVDRLHGGSQAVVKPLSGALRGTGGLLGTTVLGDGRVALILDVAGLVRDALRSGERTRRTGHV